VVKREREDVQRKREEDVQRKREEDVQRKRGEDVQRKREEKDVGNYLHNFYLYIITNSLFLYEPPLYIFL